jgi:hypothetical protein
MGSNVFVIRTQRKRWITMGLMGCVHTHQKMFVIEGWGSPGHIRNVVKKTCEGNKKSMKINRTINQAPAPSPEHDKIWAQWALDIPSESMLKNI